MKYTAIITAAGRGTRMGSDTPKQYMPVCGKPVLFYALRAFDLSPVDEMVITCAPGEENFVEETIVKPYGFKTPCKVVAGGAERCLSVKNGILAAKDADYVMIHDAARPLLDLGLIKECMDSVVKYNACVPAVPVSDTIRLCGKDGISGGLVDRSRLLAMQTPQCFRRSLILEAYATLEEQNTEPGKITDDASVVELAGLCPVMLIPGNPANKKITTAEDLLFAEAVLKSRE